MKKIIFLNHAEERRRQRGFTSIEIQFVIERPKIKRKRSDGRIEVIGNIRNRTIKIIYEEEENYINIVSLI